MDTLQLNLVTENVANDSSIQERKRNLESPNESWNDEHKPENNYKRKSL